jgi:hypothetical protein
MAITNLFFNGFPSLSSTFTYEGVGNGSPSITVIDKGDIILTVTASVIIDVAILSNI